MNTLTNYREFIARKQTRHTASGFDVADSQLNPILFDWQKRIVVWACRMGRAAIFAECGMGKTFMQTEWAKHVASATGGRVLILSPLAVAHQTVSEAAKLGIRVVYCRSQADVDGAQSDIVIANYEMMSAFDLASFAGVVLDESSILKSFNSSTRNQLVDSFARTPYRLACTATPSPNDHMELGNHAEFLGVLKRVEMLAMYFKHDGGDTASWRLKRHGEKDFWRWVTSWAICASKPSDIGGSDDGFVLPPLQLHDIVVGVDQSRAHDVGMLFLGGGVSATGIWKEKRLTTVDRCAKAAELVNPDEPWIVWCDTNDEADELKRLLPYATEVRGSDSVKEKERKLSAFSNGDVKTIITKSEIAGFGLNWQHCANMVFVGVTYSFEKTYQALRRSWRFGQTLPVNAYLVYAESEGDIRSALVQKQKAHHEMQDKMSNAMRENGIVNTKQVKAVYEPSKRMSIPAFI